MGVWNWLKDPDNRGTLGWFGGGIAVVASALWAVFIYALPPRDGKSEAKPTTAITASGGGIAIGGNVMNSTVTAGSQALPGTGPGKGPSQQ